MQHSSTQFRNKIILIMGGTSGIGLATAIKFAEAGAEKVIVCGRRKSKWEAAQNQSQVDKKQYFERIVYKPCDVRIEAQVKALIASIFDDYKRLDVCFNNAGVQPGVVSNADSGNIDTLVFDSFEEEDGAICFRIPPPQPHSKGAEKTTAIKEVQETPASPFAESEIATSCIGMFYCLKWQTYFIFKQQPNDLPVSIINTSSRNGVLPDAHRPLYAASKSFILTLTKSVANQLAQRCIKEKRAIIRVNAISPGPVDTPLEFGAYGVEANDKAHYPDYVKAASIGVPMHRTASPDEIAPSVLFLADTEMSSYITGSNICVDGGHTGSPLLCACEIES